MPVKLGLRASKMRNYLTSSAAASNLLFMPQLYGGIDLSISFIIREKYTIQVLENLQVIY